MSSSPTPQQPPVSPLMRMGCTRDVITYRAQGNETVCLQNPSQGVQILNGFNMAAGDVLGLDDVLETTLAHANLSDIANYITSQVVNGNTTLYVDPTGHGKQGMAFATLEGVSTTVAQLVAGGGMKYIPDHITLTPTTGQDFTFRPDGLETALVLPPHTGLPAQNLYGFDPSKGDTIDLGYVLNPTAANPNLSDIATYIQATAQGGDTVLSVDRTGSGTFTPFAVIKGVTATLAQLLAEHALAYTPSATTVEAKPGESFAFRASGSESALLMTPAAGQQAAVLTGFSLQMGDRLALGSVLSHAGIQIDPSAASTYFTTTESGGNTTLWFNAGASVQSPAASGSGVAVAVLQGVQVSLADLVAANAFVTTPNGFISANGAIMRMGCTNELITYRGTGHETVCLQTPSQGEQKLAGFDPSKGDVIGLDDVLERTQAHANLSDIAHYLTATTSSAGTTLWFDPNGTGKAVDPVALIEGVQTSVAALAADGGIAYIPDRIDVTGSMTAPVALRPDGLETVDLLMPTPQGAPQVIQNFDPTKGDILELQGVLNPTLASADLSDIGQYLSSSVSNGSTTLYFDRTGTGQAGVPLAVLQGIATSVPQLLAAGALDYTPSPCVTGFGETTSATFRAAGMETILLPNDVQHIGVVTYSGFSAAAGDALDLAPFLSLQHVTVTAADFSNYFTASQSNGSTTIHFDPTGHGGAGFAIALLKGVSESIPDLLAHNALHLS